MEVIIKLRPSLEMEVTEVHGDLTGRDALKFEEYLYTCLDDGKYYQLLNLKQVRKIDGLGINVLSKFIVRGMQIRLFNVRTEIEGMIKLSKKEKLIKRYKKTDSSKVILMFEKEISKEKDTFVKNIRRRRSSRIDNFSKTEFKFQSGNNGALMCKANVLNLSESGVFADQIKSVNDEKGKVVSEKDLIRREIHNLKFELNGTSEFIETNGECVWSGVRHGRICAGIRFVNISKENKGLIIDYIHKILQA